MARMSVEELSVTHQHEVSRSSRSSEQDVALFFIFAAPIASLKRRYLAED
jgi:hypothetical protein